MDDDDVYYRDHISELINFLEDHRSFVAYSDAVKVLQYESVGEYLTKESKHIHPIDFNAEKILVSNYIPDPRCLLSLFAGLLQSELGDRVEMHLFGSVNDCGDMFDPYESLIGNKIILHGTVERGMAYRAMREASVLVNIGNTTSYQLSSKVVEYASTGKPVLNIVKIRDDSSADFFSFYGLCMNVIDEGKKFEGEELADIVRFIKNPPVEDPEKHRNLISVYMVDEILGKYEEILSSLESSQMRIKRNFNA